MNSPCVNCNSYPCACHGPFVQDGRYTFNPFTYEPIPPHDSYQPHMHCVDCYSHPCVCRDYDSVQSGPTIYCAICYHHPCSCHIMTCGCLLGLCQCTVGETSLPECDYGCVDADCPGCLVEEEPRELHDVDNWAHRSKKMICGTCMWFTHKLLPYKAEPGVIPIGRCRKKAPTLNGWPVLYETDWCGDHKLDETKT
jgi:hypothetical protein